MPTLTKLVLTYEPAPDDLARIRAAFPDLDLVICTDPEQLPAALDGAQAMAGWGVTPSILAGARDLRWIQTMSAGVDRLLFPELVASDVILTNARGVYAPNMAEHILALMLAFARGLPDLMRRQVRHDWGRPESGIFELGGQTLGVVGLGAIGRELAWRANALGMRVLGLRRHPGEPPRGVERVYPADRLHGLLAEADHVAITLPLTPATRRLVGPAEFAAMRSNAYIYNVGRGPVIDQDALIAALRAGQIRGAGLDVTDPEPLPPDSPLWDMPNVILTDHTSGHSPRGRERGTGVLLANIERFRRDQPLLNVVDKQAGY